MYTQRVKRCHEPSFERNSADEKTVYSRAMYGIVEYNQIIDNENSSRKKMPKVLWIMLNSSYQAMMP